MRCKGCGKCKHRDLNKHKCWVNHQLCGKCALAKYPEDFPYNITGAVYN